MSGTAPQRPAQHGSQHLVLLGSGRSHLDLLAHWAAHPLAGAQVTLIAPHPVQCHLDRLAGLVAGHCTLSECGIALEPLVKKSGIRWLTRYAVGLDAQAKTVLLDDGSKLAFDWLSINTGTTQDRTRIEEAMPGAREYGLFVRPLESFTALWPRVTELAPEAARSVAVIGGDATSIELVMAIRHRLPGAAVTLVTGGAPVASTYPEVMQRSVVKALKARDVTVLLDRCVGLQRGEVLLGCGARLACDVPVLATDLQAPAWFGNSGLALDKEGLIAIDACQRSASHPNVFAAGSVTTTRVGAALEHSLAAATAGREPRIQPPLQPVRQWLSCGDGTAIAYWHGLAVQGRWVGAWKDRVDRRFIASYDKSALRP